MEAGHPGQIEPPLSDPPADPQGERQRRGWLKVAGGLIVVAGGLWLIFAGGRDVGRPAFGQCKYGEVWSAKEGHCVAPPSSPERQP